MRLLRTILPIGMSEIFYPIVSAILKWLHLNGISLGKWNHLKDYSHLNAKRRKRLDLHFWALKVAKSGLDNCHL
jgi:hypothetical protein